MELAAIDSIHTPGVPLKVSFAMPAADSSAARTPAARAALSQQGASMVFAVVVLLYYWSTGGEIWYSASIGRRELGLRAGTTGEARCALTAHQRSQPPTLLG